VASEAERPSTSHESFSGSGTSGVETSLTRGRAMLPSTSTPASTGRPLRSARTFSCGLSIGPLKTMTPRSIASFWP
jgi:hypothetical protein